MGKGGVSWTRCCRVRCQSLRNYYLPRLRRVRLARRARRTLRPNRNLFQTKNRLMMCPTSGTLAWPGLVCSLFEEARDWFRFFEVADPPMGIRSFDASQFFCELIEVWQPHDCPLSRASPFFFTVWPRALFGTAIYDFLFILTVVVWNIS